MDALRCFIFMRMTTVVDITSLLGQTTTMLRNTTTNKASNEWRIMEDYSDGYSIQPDTNCPQEATCPASKPDAGEPLPDTPPGRSPRTTARQEQVAGDQTAGRGLWIEEAELEGTY